MPIIISTNTTISGLTQYTDDVQVAPGVTLTILAGGVLDLGGYELLNYGTLTLAGSSSAFATMRSGKYSTDSTSGTLNSNFGRLEGVVVDGFFSDGSLNLDSTVVIGSLIDALARTRIDNSIFVNSPFDLGIENNLTVTRTTFKDSLVSSDAWPTFGNGTFGTFTQSNFISNGISIKLDPFFAGSHSVSFSNNYMYVEPGASFEDKVYDRDDNLRVGTDLMISSFQSAPYLTSSSGVTVGAYSLSLAQLGVLDVPPTVLMANPVHEARGVPVDANILITFSEEVQRGSGTILLKGANGEVIATYDVATSANLSISGATLTINPTQDLKIYSGYQVEVGPGAVNDLAGNAFAGTALNSFTTQTIDGLYHFFVVAFAAAPGVEYMNQLAEAYNYGLSLKEIVNIFTTKPEFTGVYSSSLSNYQLATQLVSNVVKGSATEQAKAEAVLDIEGALDIGWTRGDVIYQVFGNLAAKPLNDPTWGNTALQFLNQTAVARYYTEVMLQDTTDIPTLRAVVNDVTPFTDVSTPEAIVTLIGVALIDKAQ